LPKIVPPDTRGNAPDTRGRVLPGGHYFSAAADRLKKSNQKNIHKIKS
jgi:hypothetical protein